MDIRFHDRIDAGDQLAEALTEFEGNGTVVLGLARGGVVLAERIARRLGCPLDVLVARKVGAPDHPEYGIGAVAPEGIKVYDHEAVVRLGVTGAELDERTKAEEREMERRLAEYRDGRPPAALADRDVILVDDGLATGITALAAIRYVRAHGPRRVVLAVPVCSREGAKALAGEVDRIVCLQQPNQFYAVGQFYGDFGQVDDAEVKRILAGAGSKGWLS